MPHDIIHRRLSSEAYKFIDSLCDLGYLESKQRQVVFDRILKERTEERIELPVVKRILAAFLFEENPSFSEGQQEMLLREWPLLFG